MFKKLVKSTLALALIAGSSAFAMQKPAAAGRIQVGLTPAQTAAQKEQFAKLIQQAETRKAAAKAKAAATVNPAERSFQQKQVDEAEQFARELREERDAFERAQRQAIPAWPAPSVMKPTAPTLSVRPAAAQATGPVILRPGQEGAGRWVSIPGTSNYRFIPAEESESGSETSSSSGRSRAGSLSSSGSESDHSNDIDDF